MAVVTEALSRLKVLGIKLDTVYDIGAHRGTWSLEAKEALPDAKFFLFEANPVWEEDLKATGMTYVLGCLSNSGRGQVEFWNGPDTGASYYREDSTFYDGQASTTMPTVALDDIIWREKWPWPDVIKLDTQGSELDILAGGKRSFAHASVIQCELPLFPYNAGAPSMSEYLGYFRDHGFLPVHPLESTFIDGILVHMDMLFLSKAAKERCAPTEHLRV
jgi:FkbM family methyltransferase